MKISIIGGGNMGSSIAYGLATSNLISPSDITVINRNQKKTDEIKCKNDAINSVTGDYGSLNKADIIILAVKPWMIEDVLKTHQNALNSKQLIVSVASGITLQQLSDWTPVNTPVFRVMPNTAIAIKESMTFISSLHTSSEQDGIILNIFSELGKAQFIEEKLQSAASALAGCGIAYAFRYIRAAMEGGIEMGIKPTDAKQIVIQTLRGAANLLEANGTHPEDEIDKVTTPGGITIKGLNEMEHAGFTSAVIRGLKASNILNILMIFSLLFLTSCTTNNRHDINLVEIDSLSNQIDTLEFINNDNADDCIFDTSTYKFTTDALINFDPNIVYSWNNNTKEAKAMLANGDTLYLSIGGCYHFGYQAKLITQIPFEKKNLLLNKTRWIAKSFFKNGFEDYDQYIKDSLYTIDNESDNNTLKYDIIRTEDIPENQILNGFVFKRQSNNTSIEISGYLN